MKVLICTESRGAIATLATSSPAAFRTRCHRSRKNWDGRKSLRSPPTCDRWKDPDRKVGPALPAPVLRDKNPGCPNQTLSAPFLNSCPKLSFVPVPSREHSRCQIADNLPQLQLGIAHQGPRIVRSSTLQTTTFPARLSFSRSLVPGACSQKRLKGRIPGVVCQEVTSS